MKGPKDLERERRYRNISKRDREKGLRHIERRKGIDRNETETSIRKVLNSQRGRGDIDKDRERKVKDTQMQTDGWTETKRDIDRDRQRFYINKSLKIE